MTSQLLTIAGVSKHFDGVAAIDGFSCTVGDHEIVGLMGPNGAGKTTLFNVITGFLRADSGSASFRGLSLLQVRTHRMAALGIARTFQTVRLGRRMTVLENVLLAYQTNSGERLRSVLFCPWSVARREARNRKAGMALLEEIGLAETADNLAATLSYGQQKLLSIACCLATGADLLLLDEPLAGIAPRMTDRILATIASLPPRGKSVLLIEHDVAALSRICERVIFMDAGKNICEGAPEAVRNDLRVIEAYLE